VELDTNQGVEVIRRKIDCKTWMVWSWDGWALPQIWIPFAHIGCKWDLYMVSLVCIESFDFKIRQSRCTRLLRIIIFCLKWGLQVNLLSMWCQDFTSKDDGIWVSKNNNLGRKIAYNVIIIIYLYVCCYSLIYIYVFK